MRIILLSSFFFIVSPFVNGEDDNVGSETGFPQTKLLSQFNDAEYEITSEADAVKWLQESKSTLGFSENSSLSIKTISSISNATTIYSVQQEMNGLPIFAHVSNFVIEFGKPTFALTTAANLPAQAVMSEQDIESAINTFANEKKTNSDSFTDISQVYWKTERELVPALVVSSVSSENKLLAGYKFIIDKNGRILTQLAMKHDFDFVAIDVDLMCQRLKISELVDFRQLLDITINEYHFLFNVVSSSAEAGSAAELKLAQLLESTARFMGDKLSQASISEYNDVTLVAYTGQHYKDDYGLNCTHNNNANAFWATLSEEVAMIQIHGPFMDNPEVVMHEIGHGIVAYSSELIYQGQSGALNEAYGDAVGVSFLAWLDKQMDSPELKHWRLHQGQEVIRDFINPTRYDFPDYYKERYKGSEDHGGVHINSSIINHAFYLLTQGGQHRRLGGDEVPAIGMESALKIWHYGTTKLLTPTSNFRDARFSFAKSAELIYGKYSIERTAVHKAFDAVGVPGAWREHKKPEPQKTVPEPQEPQNKKQEVPPFTPKKEPAPKSPPSVPASTSNSDSQLPPANSTDGLLNQKLLYSILSALIFFVIIWKLVKRAKPAVQDHKAYAPYNIDRQDYVLTDGGKHNEDSPFPVKNEAYLYLHAGDEVYTLYRHDVEGEGVTIGRSSKAIVRLKSASISSFHLKIFKANNCLYIEDLGSRYGTFINKRQLEHHQSLHINKNAQFELADTLCRLSISNDIDPQKSIKQSRIRIRIEDKVFSFLSEDIELKGICIGRGKHCELVISLPSVSSEHGRLKYKHGHWYYIDNNSTNGSSVSMEQEVSPTQIEPNTPIKLSKSSGTLFISEYKLPYELLTDE